MGELLKTDMNTQGVMGAVGPGVQWDVFLELGLGDRTQEKGLGERGGQPPTWSPMASSPVRWPGREIRFQRTEHGKGDEMSLLSLGYKRSQFPSRWRSPWLFSRACSDGERHATRKGGCSRLWPTASREPDSWSSSVGTESPRKHCVGLGAVPALAELEVKPQLTP